MNTIMATGRIHISSLDGNGFPLSKCSRNCSSLFTIPISVKPMFGVPLETKKVSYIWSFSLKSSNCRTTKVLLKGESKESVNDGFLEKELKFKPTFDDYLKAMESVRTVKEKYSTKDAKGHYPKKGLRGKDILSTPILDGKLKSFKLCESELHAHSSENANSMRGDELPEREGLGGGKSGYRGKGIRGLKNHSELDEVETEDAGKAQALSLNKLDDGASDAKSKVGDGDKRKLSEISGRWMKNQDISLGQKSGKFRVGQTVTNKGRSDAVKQLSGNVALRQQELGLNEGSIQVKKDQLNQDINKSKNVSDEVLRDELVFRGKVASKLEHFEPANIIQEEMSSSGNQLHFNLNGSDSESKPFSPGSTVTHESLGGYHLRAGDSKYKLSRKNFKLTNGRKPSLHIGDDDLELERAAFKSFEVFTDVKDRPRVLRMEMEERIQKLAKW